MKLMPGAKVWAEDWRQSRPAKIVALRSKFEAVIMYLDVENPGTHGWSASVGGIHLISKLKPMDAVTALAYTGHE